MGKEKMLDKDLHEEISVYARISVDTEKESDENTSVENQLKIIHNFIKTTFPNCTVKEYIDRDRSGYTFEQRENYQEMRKALMNGKSKILIVKDFSRFSRRTSLGLWELEQMRDEGVRIISVMDGVDFPTHDDWLNISVRFMTNELPVTEASKKVRGSILTMQQEGEWLCAVPYGYCLKTLKGKQKVVVVPEEAEIVREIYRLYAHEGWGYKKIANYLTDMNIPTPRMKEKERAEEDGKDYKRKVTSTWAVVTLQSLLCNDFYIGTYRGHKYTRVKINGVDRKVDEEEHIVIEKHHEAIVDDRLFLFTQEQLETRTKAATKYRGVKKYETPYTGYLFCGDCKAPMFSRSRPDLEPSYICGTYHKRGLKECTSHHVRLDFLDGVLKDYVRFVKMNCSDMMEKLEQTIADEAETVKESEKVIALLEGQLTNAKEELKATKKQKIKELARNTMDPELIDETYAEIEDEIMRRIHGLQEQLKHNISKRSKVVEIARVSKTVFEVFDNILEKPQLSRIDIALIVNKIFVYESGLVEIKLKADIEELLKTGYLPSEEKIVNFNCDSIDISSNAVIYRQKIRNQRAKVYTVNVVNSGDPLEIFTDREGEIILKKYSPIGELGAFAKEYAESLAQTVGHITCIVDKDQIIAVSGGGKKEFFEKHISSEMENCINKRTALIAERNDANFVPVLEDDNGETYNHQLIMPIIAEGDAMGAIVFLSKDQKMGEVEGKLAQTAAGFLGKQMEQ